MSLPLEGRTLPSPRYYIPLIGTGPTTPLLFHEGKEESMIPSLFRIWNLDAESWFWPHLFPVPLGAETTFYPSDHQPLGPLSEKSLWCCSGVGVFRRLPWSCPWVSCGVSVPGVFEATCNPHCSQPWIFLVLCSFHVPHLLPPPPFQLGLPLLCTSSFTLKPSLDSSANTCGQAHPPRQ